MLREPANKIFREVHTYLKLFYDFKSFPKHTLYTFLITIENGRQTDEF